MQKNSPSAAHSEQHFIKIFVVFYVTSGSFCIQDITAKKLFYKNKFKFLHFSSVYSIHDASCLFWLTSGKKHRTFFRGYYRCSSSKGCPARKQVERNRTDPSMLVITYNSEHNHPWPTQRNALAGSSRSHHAKQKNCNNSSSASKQNNSMQKAMVKADLDQTTDAAARTTTTSTTGNSNPPATAVKEEEIIASELDKGMQHATDHDTSVPLDPVDLMQQMFNQSYRPMIQEGAHHDDFFADLAELESDPMSLIFSNEYMENRPVGEPTKEMAAPDKSLADPFFNMLDWGATTPVIATSAAGSSSLEQQGESGL
jgi:hypothetical protein